MNVDTVLTQLERTIAPKNLKPLHLAILRGSYQGLSYNVIADQSGYDEGYLRDTGSDLWRELSQSLGRPVNKLNLRCILSELAEGPAIEFQTRVHWGEAVNVKTFYGRNAEQKELVGWLKQEKSRLVSIDGLAGVGKTALAVKVVTTSSHYFENVFWQRLRKPQPIERLMPSWLDFFAKDEPLEIPDRFSEQLCLLIEILRQQRSLLILDGFDILFAKGEFAASYQSGYENYGELLNFFCESEHQSTLLLTSREKPIEVSSLESKALPIKNLSLKGLGEEESEQILRDQSIEAEAHSIRAMWSKSQGNPLALQMTATTIRELFDNNLEAFLCHNTMILTGIKELLNQQFQYLTEVEQSVIYWLASQRHALTIAELEEHITPSFSNAILLETLSSLKRRSLLTSQTVKNHELRFSLPRLVREYVLEEWLIQTNPLAPDYRGIHQGTWEYDVATEKVSWSPELFAILDWDISDGEPDYGQMLQLHFPADQTKLQQAVERTLKVGESYCLTLRHLCPDGSIRYVESIGHLERNRDGSPKRLYGITQDVTYRMESQDEQQLTEASNSSCPGKNSHLSPKHNFENGSSSTITQSKKIPVLANGRSNGLALESSDRNGHSRSGDKVDYGTKGHALNGHVKNDRVALIYQPQTLGMESNPLNSGLILPQNASFTLVRHDHAQAYQDLNTYYDNLPIAYFSLNSDGNFVYINQAALDLLGGYKKEELLGKSMGYILNEDFRVCFQVNYPLFKERGWIKDKELIGLKKDQTTFPIVMSAKVMRDQFGEFLMTRTFFADEKDKHHLTYVNPAIP